MDDTGNPTQDGQTDVDEEVSATATLQEDTQRGQDDGEDDLADVTGKRLVRRETGDGRRERGREGASDAQTYEAVKGIVTGE